MSRDPASNLANARYLARVLAGLNLDLSDVPATREAVVTLEILSDAKAKLLAIDVEPLSFPDEDCEPDSRAQTPGATIHDVAGDVTEPGYTDRCFSFIKSSLKNVIDNDEYFEVGRPYFFLGFATALGTASRLFVPHETKSAILIKLSALAHDAERGVRQ